MIKYLYNKSWVIMMSKCVMCGNEFDDKNNKYYCNGCLEKMRFVKQSSMVDKAEKLLMKKMGHFERISEDNILECSKIVRKNIENGIDKFSSIPEVAAAIQMQRIRLNYESQKKIGDAKVDFYIPEIKIILEVDGSIYHSDSNKNFLRDRRIMSVVGEKWEIVHIDANKIPKYSWNLRDGLPYVVSQRNEQWRFRDSEFDSYYLMDFYDFEKYLRREAKNEDAGLFKTN